jgi:redox-sensing transcriptional repressor
MTDHASRSNGKNNLRSSGDDTRYGGSVGASGSQSIEASPGGLRAAQPVIEAGSEDIPDIVIRRLPIYVRTLKSLTDDGIHSVSSEALASMIGVTAAQIRRDLSYFGKFGKQGKGYDIAYLSGAIEHILKLDRQWPMVLVGMGRLGHAIASYRGFSRSSFTIVGLFDSDEDKVGGRVNEFLIQPISDVVDVMRDQGIRVGIIATPRVEAQEAADLLVEGGAEAILNYAPVILRVPENVTVREIDPVSALQSMTYYIGHE